MLFRLYTKVLHEKSHIYNVFALNRAITLQQFF